MSQPAYLSTNANEKSSYNVILIGSLGNKLILSLNRNQYQSIDSMCNFSGLFHNGGQHGGSTLARSHSIASSGDKSLMLMSTTAQFPLTNIDNIGNGQGTTNLQF